MKKTLKYISAAAAMLGAVALSGCNDNFERPPMVYPSCDWEPNTTIADLKTQYWSSERNYVATPGYHNADTQDPIYIHGRVISDSESGNIYNSIVIQDETGAINIAVRTNGLSDTYMFGQEVVVNVTGLKIGGYNGLMQLGAEGTYNGAPSMTFMEATVFESHSGINGIPEAAAVDTVLTTISEVMSAKTTNPGLIKWQSQLVRVDNVTFEEAGKPLAGDANTNRYVKDSDGNRLNIRTSSYADFKGQACPKGTGSVVGILSYYGSDWQLLLNGYDGLIGFEPTEVTPDEPVGPNPPSGTGTGEENNPYTVGQVQGGATGSDKWVSGYIVGWVEGQVLADGAHFSTPATVQSNILLAASADVKDVKDCIPVQLPSGSDARTQLNLVTNPGNLGKAVSLKGSLERYFGTAGVKSVTEFKIEGGGDTPTTPTGPVSSLNADFESGALPAGWTQVQVAGNKSWYVTQFQENYYAAMTGYKGTAPFDQWLITPAIDMAKVENKILSFRTQVNGYGSTTSSFEVYVMTAATPDKGTKTKLTPNLPTAPASGYSDWGQSGSLDLSSYSGTIYIGFRYAASQDANYATWCVDDIKLNAN